MYVILSCFIFYFTLLLLSNCPCGRPRHRACRWACSVQRNAAKISNLKWYMYHLRCEISAIGSQTLSGTWISVPTGSGVDLNWIWDELCYICYWFKRLFGVSFRWFWWIFGVWWPPWLPCGSLGAPLGCQCDPKAASKRVWGRIWARFWSPWGTLGETFFTKSFNFFLILFWVGFW